MDYAHLELVHIVVHASPGSSINDCLRDAIEMAATDWQNVELHHNGKIYKVRTNDLLNAVESSYQVDIKGNVENGEELKRCDVCYKTKLLNLLAVVHRDGGHYTDTHGLKKSVNDAMEIIASMIKT